MAFYMLPCRQTLSLRLSGACSRKVNVPRSVMAAPMHSVMLGNSLSKREAMIMAATGSESEIIETRTTALATLGWYT